MNDLSTERSGSAWLIIFTGCPIVWASKLQTETALSSTAESEMICLSQSLREEVIPLMEFFKVIREQGIIHRYQTRASYCKLFEDNSAALEISKVPKM